MEGFAVTALIIRKSLKTSLAKALDPEQHGLGELSARSLIDKKVIIVIFDAIITIWITFTREASVV